MAGDHLLQGVCGEVLDLEDSIIPALYLEKVQKLDFEH